jgi:hypothetical protein
VIEQWIGADNVMIYGHTNPWLQDRHGDDVNLMELIEAGVGKHIDEDDPDWCDQCGMFPGVIGAMDTDDGIQCCDQCRRYDSDLTAAKVLADYLAEVLPERAPFTVWFERDPAGPSQPVKPPAQLVAEVFTRWKQEVTTGWASGIYTPNEDQFAEMAVEAIERDQAQRQSEPTPPKTGGTALTRALTAWADAEDAFTESAEEAERSGREIPAEAFWARDDAAVQFADSVELFVTVMTGLTARIEEALAHSIAETPESDVLSDILTLLEKGQQ